jgi:hypothetical protein
MMGALGAKHELTQSMFTKTMAMQVWRPEFERPGRHFVYTSRYVQFFFKLLEKTNDRANYGLLLRKLRRKSADYYDHRELWQEECTKYVKMLRRSGSIPEAQEDTVFKAINHDEFTKHADSLEKWATVLSPDNNTLEILREVVEIKKLNAAYMKSTLIDDLVGDTYAKLYLDVTPALRDSGDTPGKIADAAPSDKQAPSDQPSRSRIKGVGRRELLRRAEAAGSSPAAATPQVLALRQAMANEVESSTSPTISVVRVVIDTPRNRSRSIGGTERGDEDAAEEKDDRPGSIHDSADDESELSELDDTAELDDFKQELDAGLISNSTGSTAKNIKSYNESPGTFTDDQGGENDELEENEDAEPSDQLDDAGAMDVD